MSRPRCVFDTDALISAGLSPHGTPQRVLSWVVRRGTLLVSEATLEEFASRFIPREKFDRYLSPPDRVRFVTRIEGAAEVVVVTTRLAVCADPDDDRFSSSPSTAGPTAS